MLIWMVVIFMFSARPADESEEDSLKVGMMIGEIFVPDFEQWDEADQIRFAQRIDHPVRKTAHASEYAVLTLFISGVCIGKESSEKHMGGYAEVIVPWAAASLYAATDEFHQLFVPGRSGQITDVILDSAGALGAVLVLTGIRYLRKGYLKKAERNNQGAA